jgi:Cd2+/Zn2+-exporting ATPase
MTLETRTLTFPVHQHPKRQLPAEWRPQWRFEADSFVQALGPRQGVSRIQLNHDTGTVLVEYDPNRFSLDQMKAFGSEMGVLVGGAVYHSVLDLPQCNQHTAMAQELEDRLTHIPGVARAAVNPAARTLTVEYFAGSQVTEAGLLQLLRRWGYWAREAGLAAGWWERNRLAVFTVACALGLVAAWLAESATTMPWLAHGLYALAYLAGGGYATRNSLNALRHRRLDVDLLMVTAAIGAAIIHHWMEGGLLLFLFALSNALEHYAMDRTRQAIRALMALKPATAHLVRNGLEVTTPVEALEIGDRLNVHPGERLPADGRVVSGRSAVDQSPITGESIPVERGPGDPVFAGSINGNGALGVQVGKRAQDSTLSRIILLVEEAQSERAPTQRRLDSLEQRYAAGIIGFAALVAVSLPLAFGWTWADAFYKSMTLLVVASPCALVISTPASILSAIAAGARHGVLFKGGAHVESLAGVRVVAFDKTGTLTTGRPRVTDVLPAEGASEAELLTLAAAVEARSDHPLARAVVAAAQERGLPLPEADDLQAVPGRGVTARLAERILHIGTVEHLQAQGVMAAEAILREAERLELEGKTVMLVGDGCLLGLIAVADTLRPEASAAVAALKAAGVERVVMLSGDNARAAYAIGAAAGVDEVRAELLPEDKVTEVHRLRERFGSVAMVGDGVNDAPALASATVGIAMGAGGSDVALETADVVLMSSDLSRLPYAAGLSRRAMSVVGQNLTFALAVIVTLIFSAFLNFVTLPLGVVGHEGSTVIVVLNGLRLLGFRPRR